jgi:Holliday junction resolvasome RuvABC DNA-binding subunit
MKQIDKNEFIEMAKDNTRNVVAKHFGIADMTAQRLADQLGIKFKKFKPSGRNKFKYELI